jgi:hypothetical protein
MFSAGVAAVAALGAYSGIFRQARFPVDMIFFRALPPTVP